MECWSSSGLVEHCNGVTGASNNREGSVTPQHKYTSNYKEKNIISSAARITRESEGPDLPYSSAAGHLTF